MWGLLIGIFIGLWILQIVLAALQLKHYQTTIKEMSNRSSGYLGVGVDKKKLGVGSVVIIVCDNAGKIIESKRMHGVTVFQRFSNNEKVLNKFVDDLINERDQEMYHATSMAVKNIKDQMEIKVSKEGGEMYGLLS